MTLRDKILSEQNIFTAIYSLESYVFEKGLLSKEDLILYNQLTDKFNEDTIKMVINTCKERITQVLSDENLFDIQVYFKLKKYDEETGLFVFRPIHTTDLISQICMVSMLLPLMYQDENGKRQFSELAKIIPHNFYGNVPSDKVDCLFIKWQHKYKQYSETIIHKSKEYKESKQYKNEVCLDLKDFFPSIDPCYIYNFITRLLAPLYDEEDKKTLCIVLQRLLFFRICKENICDWLREYYPNMSMAQYDSYINRGIAQGLPQSYFFGNICMISVANVIKQELEGEAFYYVDDSIVFTNRIKDQNEFNQIMNRLNKQMKIVLAVDEKMRKECYSGLSTSDWQIASNISYKVQFHKDKSFYNTLENGVGNTGGLQYLTRQVSMFAALSNNLDDDEDTMSLDKLSKLIEVIDHELNKLQSKSLSSTSTYDYKNEIKLLKRHKKYFLFRERFLKLKKSGEVCKEYWNEYKERFQINDTDSFEQLSKTLDEEILQSESRLLITNSSESEWEDRYESIKKWEKRLAKDKPFLYYAKDLQGAWMYGLLPYVKYESLKAERRRNARLESSVPDEKKWMVIEKEIKLWHKKQKQNDYAEFIRKTSDEYTRLYYNAFFSYLYNVDISDRLNLVKVNNRCLNYTELRVLAYLRNRHFKQSDFERFLNNIYEHQDSVLGNIHIDMAILEVLHILITTVKNPQNIDDIILTHRVVSAMWKNGSKFLNAYTLHNEEHAICLIKQCKHILSTIDYLGLKQNDYYVLFLACYLHDISMVIHPDLSSFLQNNVKTNLIATENKLRYLEEATSSLSTYQDLLLKTFNDVYSYFENEKRANHPKESAAYIRKHNKDFFDYLKDSVVELVAKVSESHGYDAIEVYGRKSGAKNESFSLKYMMILIRLADIMDMSNDRVNYFRLRESLSSMTTTSRFHWISHLVTDKARLRATYQYDSSKRLWEHPLEETIHVDLFLNVSYTAAIAKKVGCKSCQATYLRHAIEKIELHGEEWNDYDVVQIGIADGTTCVAAEKGTCPIICAWMQQKNNYLVPELNRLCLYLNQTNTRLFSTKFEIDLIFKDTHKLDSDMFDCVHEYLQNELC